LNTFSEDFLCYIDIWFLTPTLGRVCLLYGRKCNTPVIWDNLVDRGVVGPDLLREMEEQMIKIKKN
jgi:hypothetical protein